jgi:hypothetical protein
MTTAAIAGARVAGLPYAAGDANRRALLTRGYVSITFSSEEPGDDRAGGFFMTSAKGTQIAHLDHRSLGIDPRDTP